VVYCSRAAADPVQAHDLATEHRIAIVIAQVPSPRFQRIWHYSRFNSLRAAPEYPRRDFAV
jgi:hypothetical protein